MMEIVRIEIQMSTGWSNPFFFVSLGEGRLVTSRGISTAISLKRSTTF